jgi:hypothetical protein
MTNKTQIARRERLHRVCKDIIGNPDDIDAGTAGTFKSAVLRYTHTFTDPMRKLENLYQGETMTSDLVRKAFAVIDDAGIKPTEVTKAKGGDRKGNQGLAAAVVEHALDLLNYRRRHLGIEKADGQSPRKESIMVDRIEGLTNVMKSNGLQTFCKA